MMTRRLVLILMVIAILAVALALAWVFRKPAAQAFGDGSTFSDGSVFA